MRTASNLFNTAKTSTRPLTRASAALRLQPTAPFTRSSHQSSYLTMTQQQATSVNEAKAKVIARDFRTDTITMPTDEMYDIMKAATRGDDVYQEDPATNELQEKIAKLAGKEAGLFCPSGTMTNQLAIRTHLHQPPYSIILDARAHVHMYEAGGVAFHSGANAHALVPANGHHLTLEDIEQRVVTGEDIHSAPTKIVCLENTLSGMVFPQEEIVRISDAMHELDIIMHCDGARMWEVQAKTGKTLKELCDPFDTVSLCMSKGLGAPIGSVLVGPKKFIEKARWFRKCFGGGIRQSGGLAAAANYVLDNHLPLLKRTHELASSLATRLSAAGVRIVLPVETNMLWIDPTPLGFTIYELAARAKEIGITLGANRLIVHHQITQQATDDLVELVLKLKSESTPSDGGDIYESLSDDYAQGKWEGKQVPQMSVKLGTSYPPPKVQPITSLPDPLL